jgi:hypothetical protein
VAERAQLAPQGFRPFGVVDLGQPPLELDEPVAQTLSFEALVLGPSGVGVRPSGGAFEPVPHLVIELLEALVQRRRQRLGGSLRVCRLGLDGRGEGQVQQKDEQGEGRRSIHGGLPDSENGSVHSKDNATNREDSDLPPQPLTLSGRPATARRRSGHRRSSSPPRGP